MDGSVEVLCFALMERLVPLGLSIRDQDRDGRLSLSLLLLTVVISAGLLPSLTLPKLRLSFGVVCVFTRGFGLLIFTELTAD